MRNKFVTQLLVLVAMGCLAACTPIPTPQPLPTQTEIRAPVPPNPRPADTILLYSAQILNRAAPALPTWGLRAWPVTTPFSDPVFDLIYGDLGTGENYPGYFFDFRPQQAPDGRYILIPGIGGYSRPEDPGTGLWLADLQDGSYRQLMPTVPLAVWSPQSDAIAYREGNMLYVRTLSEDATPQAIFTHEELSTPFLGWSPDGQWIAVVTLHEGDVDPQTNYPTLTQTVWLVSPTGEPTRELATLPAFAMEHVREELAWSPDSQHLILQNYLLDLQGSQIELGAILYATGVDWLPTASQLLVNRADSFQIIDGYGNVLTTLNTRPAAQWAFSPDGRRLAYIAAMPELNQWELRIFDLLHNRRAGRTTFSGNFAAISLLRWNVAGDLVYFDDGRPGSPIWSLPATAEVKNTAQPTVIVEDGLLVEVIYKARPGGPVPASADDLAGMNVETWSSASPNGVWQAEGLVAFPGTTGTLYYTELRVKKVDGSAEWMPVAEWERLVLGYTTPEPKHWSPDGRYLYFTNAPVPDGCGLFVDASGLQRLDLRDGSITEMLPPDSTWTLTVAPDGERVAYMQGSELYVLTLATGNYSATKLDMLEADAQWGRIVWAVDGHRLAFTVAYAPCVPPQWRQSIIFMDLPSLALTTLIEKDERLLTTGKWLDADRILLHDKEGKAWEMDVATGSTATGEYGMIQINQVIRPLPHITHEAAIQRIRAFADDPELEVRFVLTSTSSYAPVATYRFETDDDWYEVNANQGEVVDFGPRSLMPGEAEKIYDLTPRYSRAELEQQAKEFIIKHAPSVDLTQLTPQHGNKGHNYFFRWEDTAHRVQWAHPFVQVGLTQGGDLVTYVNTVTMSHTFIDRAD